MWIMFSGGRAQCCNLGLRISREWAKCYCLSQGESIGLDTSGKVRSSADDCRSCPTLLAPQRHNDFLVATGKNNAPILNGLDLDLIVLRARLQAELLAFLHGFAVDNREVCTLVQGDRSKDEGG